MELFDPKENIKLGELILCVGARSSGKTHTIKNMLLHLMTKNNSVVFSAFDYNWKKQSDYYTICDNPDFVDIFVKKYSGDNANMFIFDDCHNHNNFQSTEKFKDIVCNGRLKNKSLVWIGQSLCGIKPFVFEHAQYVVLTDLGSERDYARVYDRLHLKEKFDISFEQFMQYVKQSNICKFYSAPGPIKPSLVFDFGKRKIFTYKCSTNNYLEI